MFEHGDLILYLALFAAAMALVGGGLTWFMTRRYGWKPALLVPVAIVLSGAVMVLQDGGLDADRMIHGALLAVPAVIGALTGLAVAVRRR